MKLTKVVTIFSLVLGLCFALTSRASAQCALQMGKGQTLAARPLTAANVSQANAPKPDKDFDQTIVGFWHVKFMVDNYVVDEGFDQYNSDGLEILNDTAPPPTGNICLGVYDKIDRHGAKLKHPSWIFDTDNATLIGMATILEDITVDKHGRTFTGTFIVKITDLFGNPIAPDVNGQVTGERITPN